MGPAEVVLTVPGEDQPAAGSAGADVEEAVFFGEAAFLLREPGGELIVRSGGEDDGGKLEALGLVDGEEEDAVFLLEVPVGVVAEGGDFEDRFGGLVRGEGGVVVAFEHGAEIDEILDALFAGILFAVPLDEAGGGQDFAQGFLGAAGGGEAAPFGELLRENGEVAAVADDGFAALEGVFAQGDDKAGEELFGSEDVADGLVGVDEGDAFAGADIAKAVGGEALEAAGKFEGIEPAVGQGVGELFAAERLLHGAYIEDEIVADEDAAFDELGEGFEGFEWGNAVGFQYGVGVAVDVFTEADGAAGADEELEAGLFAAGAGADGGDIDDFVVGGIGAGGFGIEDDDAIFGPGVEERLVGVSVFIGEGIGKVGEAEADGAGEGANFFEGRGAYSFGGALEDAAEAVAIVGVAHEAKVRDGVTDFGAMEEAVLLGQEVGDFGGDEGGGDLHGGVVGTGEDGDVAPGALVFGADGDGAPGEPVGFGGGGLGFVEFNGGAGLGGVAFQGLGDGPGTLMDDGAADVEDMFGGAVVADEVNFADGGEVGAEDVEDLFGVGVAPLVDGLVDVAEEGEVAGGAGEGGEDGVFGEVGVLDFVDLNPAEAVLPTGEGELVFVEQMADHGDEVSEIDGVVGADFAFVVFEDFLNGEGLGAACVFEIDLVEFDAEVFFVIGVDEAEFGVLGDAGEEAGEAVVVVVVDDDLAVGADAEEGFAAVVVVPDDEVAVDAEDFAFGAADDGAEAVKGTGLDFLSGGAEVGLEAFADFFRGAVREGDAEDILGGDAGGDGLGGAGDEGSGFPGADRGHDEDRFKDGFGGGELFRIQSVEQRGFHSHRLSACIS